MKKFSYWKKTISGKLTILYVTMFVVVLLILNIAALVGLRYFIINNARNNLDNTASFIIHRITQEDTPYEPDIIQQLVQSEQNIYLRIISANQTIVVQSNLLKGVELPLVRGYQEANLEDRSFIYRTDFLIERGFFIGYLQTVREMTTEYRFLRVLFLILLLTSLLGIIGAVFTGYTVTRKTLQPINLLTKTAQKISSSDLGRRLEVKGPEDELTNLARTFNSMLDRLEEAFHRQEQFVSDASHELRTPIAVVQGYINLLDRWGKDEKEVREEAIEAIKKETRNMKTLVESLLFLARGSSEKIKLNKSEFYTDELIEELIRETRIQVDKVEVVNKDKEKIKMVADRELIKQMLRIFIDNSIKYTPVDGKIGIDVLKSAENIQFTVWDTGIGIPEDDLPHIFKRFYRVDKSRSDKKGIGIGLSIAKWIIDKHKGKIVVESQPGEGTRVKVTLPPKTG